MKRQFPKGKSIFLTTVDRSSGTEYIYVLGEPGKRRCKIGVSFEPELRLLHLQRMLGLELHLYFVCHSNVRPRLIERIAHLSLDHWRSQYGQEWFNCSPLRAAIAVDDARRALLSPKGPKAIRAVMRSFAA